MGTWGTRIFGDDVAHDVRDEFLRSLAEHGDNQAASDKVLSDWIGDTPDPDEEPVVWLALAATQWEYGCLLAEVKARALEVIDSGLDLARWAGSSQQSHRKGVLTRLRRKLLSEQPARRKPRVHADADVIESNAVPSPDGRATAQVWVPGSPDQEHSRLCQVLLDVEHGGQRGGGHVVVAHCNANDIGLKWSDSATLVISFPARTLTEMRKEEFFFYGQTIRLKYIEV